MTLCDGGGGGVGRALRNAPKIYMYNIYYNFYYCICLFIRNLYMYYYKHVRGRSTITLGGVGRV